MSIRLEKAWEFQGKTYSPGTILDISDEMTSKGLVDAGIATVYDPEAEARARAAADAEAERLNAQIKSAVDEALKAQQPEQKARIEIVADEADKDRKAGFKSLSQFMVDVRAAEASRPSDRLKKWVAQASTKAIGSDDLRTDFEESGGYLVPEEFSATLLQKAIGQGSVASIMNIIPVNGNTITFPAVNETSRADGYRAGGVNAYWQSEAEQYTASRPKLTEVRLVMHKLTAMTFVTDEMMADSAVAIESVIGLVADEVRYKLDDAIINGDGVGKPLGLLSSAAEVSVAKDASQAAKTFTYGNAMNMWARLPAASRGRAYWLANNDVLPSLLTMSYSTAITNPGIYNPAANTLLGRPIMFIEQCQTVGTAGDVILVDPTQYLFGMKTGGLQSATSMHLRFDYDETAYKFSLRADGQCWWSSYLTPAKGSSYISPIVTVAVRS